MDIQALTEAQTDSRWTYSKYLAGEVCKTQCVWSRFKQVTKSFNRGSVEGVLLLENIRQSGTTFKEKEIN